MMSDFNGLGLPLGNLSRLSDARTRSISPENFTGAKGQGWKVSPCAGMPQVHRSDGLFAAQQRFGLYRWHVMDPIRFREDMRVTIQALGWRTDKGRRYLPLQDDIASVAYWYQTLLTAPFPEMPDRDYLEVI